MNNLFNLFSFVLRKPTLYNIIHGRVILIAYFWNRIWWIPNCFIYGVERLKVIELKRVSFKECIIMYLRNHFINWYFEFRPKLNSLVLNLLQFAITYHVVLKLFSYSISIHWLNSSFFVINPKIFRAEDDEYNMM